uniref:Uncharacterized protein n=1 Tax=Megastigmus ssRNA virus TaxID=2602441 RepID=A0A5B8PAL2_9VIRU|nr:hypothetical protein [Megastigmus ssRNA virus]
MMQLTFTAMFSVLYLNKSLSSVHIQYLLTHGTKARVPLVSALLLLLRKHLSLRSIDNDLVATATFVKDFPTELESMYIAWQSKVIVVNSAGRHNVQPDIKEITEPLVSEDIGTIEYKKTFTSVKHEKNVVTHKVLGIPVLKYHLRRIKRFKGIPIGLEKVRYPLLTPVQRSDLLTKPVVALSQVDTMHRQHWKTTLDVLADEYDDFEEDVRHDVGDVGKLDLSYTEVPVKRKTDNTVPVNVPTKRCRVEEINNRILAETVNKDIGNNNMLVNDSIADRNLNGLRTDIPVLRPVEFVKGNNLSDEMQSPMEIMGDKIPQVLCCDFVGNFDKESRIHSSDTEILRKVHAYPHNPFHTPILRNKLEQTVEIDLFAVNVYFYDLDAGVENPSYAELSADIYSELEDVVRSRRNSLSFDSFMVLRGRTSTHLVIVYTVKTIDSIMTKLLDNISSMLETPILLCMCNIARMLRKSATYYSQIWSHVKQDIKVRVIVKGDLAISTLEMFRKRCTSVQGRYNDFRKILMADPKGPHPLYKRPSRDEIDPVNIMRNSMDEVRTYWLIRDTVIRDRYRKVARLLPKDKNELSKQQKENLKNNEEKYGLITGDKTWIVHPTEKYDYAVLFDCETSQFVDCEVAYKSGAATVYLVGKSLELMQDANLYTATEGIDINSFGGIRITNENGVAGCGKTTRNKQRFRPPNEIDSGDLILVPTRETCNDYREAFTKMYPDLDAKFLRRNVRTLDSYLLNGDSQVFDRVIVDEALMVHVGQIMLACAKAGAIDLLMIGDVLQIGFISRVEQCPIIYHDVNSFAPATVFLSLSYRCTLSTCALLSSKYPNGMQSLNTILGEMSLERFRSYKTIERNHDDEQYIVFTQSEKRDMIKEGFPNTLTVHEYQGKQNDHVVLVRSNIKKLCSFSSEPHCLVAVTRHKKTFRYITIDELDVVSGYVLTASKFTISGTKQSQYKVKGGGLVEPVTSVWVNHRRDMPATIEQENILHTIIRQYGWIDIPTAVPMIDTVQPVLATPTIGLKPNTSLVAFQYLQDFYDHVLPGVSQYDYRFDGDQVAFNDVNLFLDDMTMSMTHTIQFKTQLFDKMRPVLRTAMAKPRMNNLVECLLAMYKRNLNVPQLQGTVDQQQLADYMKNRFLDSYLRADYVHDLDYMNTHKIQPNSASILDWLTTQPPEVIRQIEQDRSLAEKNLSEYNYMIKPDVKPNLDASAPWTYGSLQTIAYHDKGINAIFCPVFRDLKERIIKYLKPQFIINMELSHDEFAKILSTRITADVLRNTRGLEVDMSKYDKSQALSMLLYETALMRMFGVHDDLILLWYNAHLDTIINDKTNKAKARIRYQRKSGDASTFIGNTLFLMGILASIFDAGDFILGVFGGDDSYLISRRGFDVDLSEVCANFMNLETKFLNCYNYPYFCSKFLLGVGENVVFIPDPVKLVTKLGRHDLISPEHVEQYRISLQDLVKCYGDASCYEQLSLAINERYRVSGQYDEVFSTIYNIVNDRDIFHSLFYTEAGDTLCPTAQLPGTYKMAMRRLRIYAPPGAGKTKSVEYIRSLGLTVGDTDDLPQSKWNSVDILFTNKPNILDDKAVICHFCRQQWDSRVIYKCGERWKESWYDDYVTIMKAHTGPVWECNDDILDVLKANLPDYLEQLRLVDGRGFCR